MSDPFQGQCRCCGDKGKVRHLAIYVVGSEGLDVCHDCEMAIVEFCRSLIRVAGRAHKLGYVAAKEVAAAKAAIKEGGASA